MHACKNYFLLTGANYFDEKTTNLIIQLTARGNHTINSLRWKILQLCLTRVSSSIFKCNVTFGDIYD